MDAESDAPRTHTVRAKPAKSVQGWIIFVRGIHVDVSEDDVSEIFSTFGRIMKLHLNLDKKTCQNKGYALIEYEDLESAQKAIEKMNNTELMEKNLQVDFAFVSRSNINSVV